MACLPFKTPDAKKKEGCFGGDCFGVSPTPFGRFLDKEHAGLQGRNANLMPAVEEREPKERLKHRNRHLVGMLTMTFAGLLFLYGLDDHHGCKKFTAEQAILPHKCKAVASIGIKPSRSMHLFDICNEDCSFGLMKVICAVYVLVMILRSCAVLPEFCHVKGRFFRISWRVNFMGELAELRDVVESDSGNWLWKRIKMATGSARESLFDWLARVMQKNSKTAPYSRQTLSNVTHTLLIINVCLVIFAMIPAIIHVSTSITFGCMDNDGHQIHARAFSTQRWDMIVCCVLGLLLIIADAVLVCKSQWVSKLYYKVGPSRECLFNQAHSPQKRRVICPQDAEGVFTKLRGMELVEVKSKSHQVLSVLEPDSWGEDDDSISLCFTRLHTHESSGVLKRNAKYSSLLAIITIAVLSIAAFQCWACISRIHLQDDDDLISIESKLLVLGSCGRHRSIGTACLMACLMLLVIFFAQTLVVASNVTGGRNESNEMEITLADHRKFQENLLCQPDQTFRSHVWVSPVDRIGDKFDELEESTGSWQIAEFTPDNVESRKTWRRSESLVEGVRVGQKTNGERHWTPITPLGLPKSDGPSTVHIAVNVHEPGKGSVWVRQIVPADFLPGAFYCSINVGNVDAWMLVSLVAAIIALALVVYDLGVHGAMKLREGYFTRCDEVLSGRCMVLEPLDADDFISASGVYMAGLGCALLVLQIIILLFMYRTSQSLI